MVAIRHDCDTQGCFMKCHHPKMEDFDGDFGTNPPKFLQFSDIDSVIDVDGYILFVEYKSIRDISIGQNLLYTRLSMLEDGNKCVVFQVVGDGANRNAEAYRECIDGKWDKWIDIDWSSLRIKIQAFASEAKARHKVKHLAKMAARKAARLAALTNPPDCQF